MAVEPIVYHGMSQCFRLFAVASYDFASAFNIIRMNGYAPLIAFDPGADGVPYASILHKDIFVPNRMPGNSIIIAMPFSTISADPQQSIIFHSRELRLKRHNKSLAVIAASDRNWQIIRFEAKKCST